MSIRRMKDWFFAVAGGLVLLLGIVLLLLNLGNAAEFTLFWSRYRIASAEGKVTGGGVSTAMIMILSAAAGVLLAYAGRSFVGAVLDLRATGGARRSESRASDQKGA